MKICKGISWSKTDSGLMILNAIDNKCIILNESGEKVWNILNDEKTYDQIFEDIYKDYNAEQIALIEQDVKELLNILIQYKFIEDTN